MSVITRRLALLAASTTVVLAAVFLVVSQSSPVASGDNPPATGGVKLKIAAASIPADLKPVVNFSLTDAKGSPLKLSDIDDGGLRFLIAAIATDPETKNTKYVNYVVNNVKGNTYQSDGQTVQPALASATQAAVDAGGAFTDLGGGNFTYKFNTAVPANYDSNATHAVGGYATRDARAAVSNDALYFVPAGGAATVARQLVTTQGCNVCHVNLAAHGGTRQDTRLCVLCHTSQTTDPETGNPVEFKVMVHKIHSGKDLPSVEAGNPYFIVGFGQNKIDFSEIGWPQDTRNCQTCHTGPQGSNFKTQPSAEACGSCHDNVDFKTGANHGGGPQANNTACSTCHPADGPEFGLSVTGAHTIPVKSKQMRGVNFDIVSFTDTKPGQNPTVVFTIKDNSGQTIKPSEMANLAFVLSGPTRDYASPPVTENAVGAKDDGDGAFIYTFQAKIPDNATGTFAAGVQGYLSTQLKDPSGQTVKDKNGNSIFNDVGFNKVAYSAVTDPVPMPRKQVVDIKNCNTCHETLALHGGSRRNTEFCVLCHNPQNTDVTKRTQAGAPMPPESISFSRLVHKIHTGEEQQEKPFIIIGGSPANPQPVNLSEARFPTDRRNCTKCHMPNSQLLSFMRSGAQPVVIKQGDNIVSSTPPVQAACLGCHDSADAKVHAQAMTVAGKESCKVCHNEGREFAVSKVHAR